ncbi:MAG: hypothetical protein EYC70_02660 [Planctomycetota bacterium]|nr:MAG: hypothetical protein EYC70_02660 [Planctomycetota bacterium]
MRGSLLARLGLVVLAAGLGWLLLRSPQPRAAGAAEALGPAPEPGLRGAELVQDPGPAAGAVPSGGDGGTAPGTSSRGRTLAEQPSDASPADLVVLVLDAAGAPAPGVPLRIDPEIPENHRATGPEGLARFPNARAAMTSAGASFRLFHNLPFVHQPVLELDPFALSSAVVVSHLPPTGGVEVRVSELDGQPAPDGSTVELTIVNEIEEAADPLRLEQRSGWIAHVREGRALFPYVELGRSWEAFARRPEANIASRARAPGPYVAGGSVLIEVVLGSDHPVVRFRAVDESGTSIARAQLKVEREALFFSQQITIQTDARGLFLLDVDGSDFFGSGAIVASHMDDDGTLRRGRKEVPAFAGPGLYEGGDVVLAPEGILASGVVVDEHGNAVEAAGVLAGGGFWSSGAFGFARGGGAHDDTDASGQFELRGLLGQPEFDVQAFKDEQRSEKVRARQGDRNLLLVLGARHSVHGRLLVDGGINPGSFGLALRDAAGQDIGLDETTIDGEGGFRMSGAPSGVYTLACRLGSLTLAEVEHLHVAGDTDAGVIDLRGRIARHSIVLTGAENPEALRGECFWRATDTASDWTSRRFEGPEIEILWPHGAVDARVLPEGYRQEEVPGLSGMRHVALRRSLVVVLELITDGALPEYPYVLDPELTQEGRRVAVPDGAPYFTAGKRVSRFLVSAAGRVRVGWHFEHRGENWAVGGGVLQGHEVDIEIHESGGEQRFTIPLDGEALTQLVRQPPF